MDTNSEILKKKPNSSAFLQLYKIPYKFKKKIQKKTFLGTNSGTKSSFLNTLLNPLFQKKIDSPIFFIYLFYIIRVSTHQSLFYNYVHQLYYLRFLRDFFEIVIKLKKHRKNCKVMTWFWIKETSDKNS